MIVLNKIYPEGIMIPRKLLETNIIHLPTVKTHVFTTITGAMKNAFGGLLHKNRHWAHADIHNTLVDLLTIQYEIHNNVFAVMDGTFAGDGPGPRAMNFKTKNMIFASYDQVAIDSISAKLMGFDPLKIPKLRIAHEKGLGIANPNEIKVIGENVNKINWNFYKTSLEDHESLCKVFENHKPEIVINLAAQAGVRYSIKNPLSYIESNLKGFGIILEACRKYKVNKITISGNTRTRDKVIRREIKIKEQEDYSGTKIKKSKGFINRRNYFESVNIKEVPSKDKPNYLDLEVEVEEKPTGYFSIQGGYSSVEALLLGVQIQENNLFGYGKSLGASVTVGTISQNFLIDYFDPYFLDTSYQFGLQLFKREYQYIDYDRARWGGVLQFGKELNTWTFARLKYRFESIKVDDLNSVATEVLQESKDKISSVTLGLTYDTRDNFMDPSKGISSSFYIQESNNYLGANLHFTEYTASFGKYYSVIPNHTLAFTADGAFIDFRNVGDRLIVSERYYLGGPENLRGYKFARVSPRRTLSNGKFVRIGGNKYIYSAFEYLYPLALETGLKGILFIDVGETYEETETIDLNPWDMKKDIGFGFRWLSPVGPLKLDFGFPLGNRESDESKFEVQFSFGSVF